MEKVWLNQYQTGVPAEIDPDSYASLNEIFEESVRKYRDKPAFLNFNKTFTYGVLEEESRAFAAYLLGALRLKKGDRVALMIPNLLQYPVALFGILRAGLIVVNINPLYTARELEYELKDAKCNTIIVLANFADTVATVLKTTPIRNVIITEVGDLLSFPYNHLMNLTVKYFKRMVPSYRIVAAMRFTRALSIGKGLSFKKPEVTGEDIAFLQYTGGTTGIAKGAMLTHRNMVANIEQAIVWIKPIVREGEETIITALPLYHIFSLTANCLTFIRAGALNVLVTNPRDTAGFVRILKKHPFTIITGVNTLFRSLLNFPAFSKLDFSRLRFTLGGGMAVQPIVATRWKAVTGVPLVEAYGLTEAAPAVCINPLDRPDYSGSIGLPISSTAVSIRNDLGEELKFNEPGELWVRGPQVMKGYWQKPEETADVLQDGWLRTGDIATIDEKGFVRIIDRKKDMILISGFNVYPNEVEEVISRMKGVLEVAVVGVLKEDGERVKAFVVKKDLTLTKEAILEHCRRELTPYKVPKDIEFRADLPKSNVGKILRRVLRE